jgi:hypothetical protein
VKKYLQHAARNRIVFGHEDAVCDFLSVRHGTLPRTVSGGALLTIAGADFLRSCLEAREFDNAIRDAAVSSNHLAAEQFQGGQQKIELTL